MFLESMHKALKYCVYEKKVIRRLDHSIHLVAVLFKDIYSEYTQRIRKPCANKKTSVCFKNHKLSLSQSDDFAVSKCPNSEMFIVKDLKKDRGTRSFWANQKVTNAILLAFTVAIAFIHSNAVVVTTALKVRFVFICIGYLQFQNYCPSSKGQSIDCLKSTTKMDARNKWFQHQMKRSQ